MNGMTIDLRTIKIWVAKWEDGKSRHQTASQLAAVMLNKALEATEERQARAKALLKEFRQESAALDALQKRLLACLDRGESMDSATEKELKAHRRKTAEMLRAADEELRSRVEDQSIMVGGLLLELKTSERSVASA